jgi:hypothetical protein
LEQLVVREFELLIKAKATASKTANIMYGHVKHIFRITKIKVLIPSFFAKRYNPYPSRLNTFTAANTNEIRGIQDVKVPSDVQLKVYLG